MSSPVSVPLVAARRLAMVRQHLTGPRPRRATADAVVALVGDLGYVQWDPVMIVAPSHLLSIWARLGPFSGARLERLLWEDKRLFEHWTPMASLVRTADYSLFASLMDRYPQSLSSSWGRQRSEAARFLAAHERLRREVLRELRAGPRRVGDFSGHSRTRRAGANWNPNSDVAEMLYHLLMAGEVMVVGHQGAQNLWGRTDDFLPEGADRRPMPADEFERAAAQRAFHALGTASPVEITHYFVRGRYERLRETLAALERAQRVRRVTIDGLPRADERYALTDDLAELGALAREPPVPRLSLIPPFDNLVASSARIERLFGFSYVREQFLPAAKRRYGTYVLPIVWGERFIGRIDPRLDKERGALVINAVHAEPDAPLSRAIGEALDAEIRALAAFVGADTVQYPPRGPAGWQAALRN